MPNLRDFIFYGFPPAFVALFVLAASVLLAPVLVGEALALFRAARGARHRRWQRWLALVQLLAGLGTLALVGIFRVLYLGLRGSYSFTVATCCSEHPYRDWPGFLDSATRQALGTYESLAVPSVVWLLIAYGLTLGDLVVLAVVRGQREVKIEGPRAE